MPDGGSGGTTQQVTKVEPWKEQKPYYLGTKGVPGVLPESADLYKQGPPAYYPGQTVAGISPETNLAWNLQAARGGSGSDLLRSSQDYLRGSIGGDYLRAGNPYLDSVYQNVASHVIPSVRSVYTAGGRDAEGAGMFADTATRALTEAYAPYAMQNYQQERGMQQQAAQMAPGVAAEDYRDIAMLGDVGRQRQQQQQDLINASMARYGYGMTAPADWLRQYAALVTPELGQKTTSQTPYYNPSPWSQVADGILGLGGLLTSPWSGGNTLGATLFG